MAVRFGGTLRELRFHLCQTSKQSAGVREFIQKHYVSLKKENPNFPILIRECNGVEPRLWARYARGIESCANLDGMPVDKILSLIKGMAK